MLLEEHDQDPFLATLPSMMGDGESGAWSVRLASCQQILRSIRLADCVGPVMEQLPSEMAL